MIEVEAKVKVLNVREMREKIKKMARFSEKVKKVDSYYTMDEGEHFPHRSLRVRKVKEHYKINFKRKISYAKGVHAKNELEFSVSDIQHFLELIKDFGFRKWLVKEKVSEVYKIKENFHIELNNVRHLGWFLEIEYLAKPSEINSAQKEVLEIMKKIGAHKKEIIKKGYTKMLWEKLKMGK